MLHMLRSNRFRQMICMGLALLSTFSFTYLLRTNQHFTMISHSLTSILLWWACWRIIRRAEEKADLRSLCICVPLGFVFSAMMVLGSMVMQYQTARFFELKTWVGVVCGTPLFAALCVLFVRDLPSAPSIRILRMEGFLSRLSDRRFFLLCWGLILLAWIPGLIASWPGVYGYDCIYQIDYYLKGEISTHHPILHTWWLGFCVVTLGDVLGSYEAGMGVYSILQMMGFSAAFASILRFIRKSGALTVLCCLGVFMFLPAIVVFSFSGTKDVMFSAFVIWTLLWLLRAAKEPPKKLAQWLHLFGLGVGMTVLRNQGIYVFALALVIGLLCMKGLRRRILCVLAACLVFFGVYQGPVSTLMKAKRVETVQEMLSVPIVQLSCARVYDAGRLSDGDRAAIEAYIPDWSYYDHTTCGISDPVKNTFNTALFREDPMAFARLWLRVAKSCPEAYINAFLRLTAGWWYPDMNYRDWSAWHPYYEYLNTDMDGWVCLKRTTPACLQWLANLYEDLAQNYSAQKIPVLSMITSSGLAAWVMLLFIAWILYRKQWAMLCPAALLAGLWGTLLLGPVVLLRYSFALLMAVPVLICTVRASD